MGLAKPGHGHIHCYQEFPGEVQWCWEGHGVPFLEPNEPVEVKGKTYNALPTFVGDRLDVKKDWRGAQVAIKGRIEPSGDELREEELIGAGAGAAES